jgi:predicted metal-dependent hydrolase
VYNLYVQLHTETPQYRVIHTNNKHSRAVLKNDVIEIRLAKRLTAIEEKKHTEELLKRMQAMHKKKVIRTKLDPFKDVHAPGSYAIETLQGIIIHITIVAGTKLTLKPALEYVWHMTLGPKNTKKQILSLIWKQLDVAALNFFKTEVECINRDTFNVPIKGVRIRHAKSVWGSCSHTNMIMLNTGLLFVPPHLLTYVIIHELAHCLEANHSKQYWLLVEKYCETYKEDRKELRAYTLR